MEAVVFAGSIAGFPPPTGPPTGRTTISDEESPPASLAARVTEAIGRVVCPEAPLHAPVFAGREWEYVKNTLDTGWVSSVGAYVDRFEEMLREITGACHAVATVNGTAALQMALLLAGVQPGDEVVVPGLTFVATANAVSHCGAHPHFADVEETALGLDAGRLDAYLGEIGDPTPSGLRNRRSGRPIRAVVAVHVFGHPCDLAGLAETCRRYGLKLVEDAAESLGSTYRGRHTGTVGEIGVLSFNGNKIVTTGGGGALLIADPVLARRAKHLTTTAKRPHPWEYFHDAVGYNFRLPNLNAALGCAQLEQLPVFLDRKRRLAGRYREALAAIDGARFVAEPERCRSNYWLMALRLDRPDRATRDAILAATHSAGFMTRPVWEPLHTLPMYGDCPRMSMEATERLAASLVNLPSGAGLELRDLG